MAKKVILGEKSREEIKQGIDIVADAVKVTLGAKGRLVALSKEFGGTHVTKDGVTVAKEIELEDPIQNVGASLIKEAAIKTSTAVGDGTTTSTLLAQQMIAEGYKMIIAGYNPVFIKKGMEQAVKVAIEDLKKQAKEVKGKDDVRTVATISANNDTEIGELIAETMEKVGKDGVITVEESQTMNNEIEYVEGMKFDRGYISPYFVTNVDSQETVLDHPYILMVDAKVSSVKELLPIVQKIMASPSRNLLVIADDVDSEALATLVVNKLKGVLPSVAIKAPGFGDNKKDILEDIAILTKGVVISEEKGRKIETTELEDLGKCEKVVVTKDDTTIIGGAGEKEEIEERVRVIKKHIEAQASDYEREKLQQRVAKLLAGVAVLKVGAVTEVELKEKKDRIDDALSATRAAIEEGIIPGGGVAFLNAGEKVKKLINKDTKDNTMTLEEALGIEIVYKALRSPLAQIADNAGYQPDITISSSGGKKGFNALTGMFEDDMIKAGIIDPVKVARLALENASSIAGIFLTIDGVVVEIANKDDMMPQSQMPPMPMM